MTNNLKVIVIGGGHNGLVCASYLAKAGLSVQILEARDSVGGACAPIIDNNGNKLAGLAHASYGLNKQILKDLDLPALPIQLSLDTISLSEDGSHITFANNSVSGRKIRERDSKSYRGFIEEFKKYSEALDVLTTNIPPRLKDMDWHDKKTLIKIGWNLRFGLGKKLMREFLRVGGINIFDVLNEKFDDPAIKGAIAFDAVLGHKMGPRTPNTVLSYLQKISFGKNNSLCRLDNLSTLLEEKAKSLGVKILTNSKIDRIIIEDGICKGVKLESGEIFKSDLVVSNADAKTTFLKFVGTEYLDAMFSHRVDSIRQEGAVARINLCLKALPKDQNLEGDKLFQRLIIAPDMQYVEHAFNHSKYGEYSDHPILEMIINRVEDRGPSVNSITATISASFAPYDLKGGWGKNRNLFVNRVFETIEKYIPGFNNLVKSYELLTPCDIEEQYNCVGGHWHHGEMGIDQSFMMRPVHGSAQYKTPLKNLYLCGASAHPGGGITGLPGHNAAKQIIKAI